jgi:hypothetical protein
MKKIISTVLTAIIIVIASNVNAQPQGKAGNPGFKELRTYFKENIKPVLIKQQADFLSVLSASELEELNKIKSDWQNVRQTMHGKTSPENRKSTQKAHFAAFNSQVEKIADAHPEQKEEYIKSMTANKELWEKDIEEIREKYDMPENKNGFRFLNRVDDPAFILMWNPEKSHEKMANKKGTQNFEMQKPGKPGMKKQINEPGIHIFPDPASTTVTARITGVKNKNVVVDIFDSQGKKVKNLFNAPSSLPALNFSFDVSKWDTGVYTVKTKFDDRNMSMDFKVER